MGFRPRSLVRPSAAGLLSQPLQSGAVRAFQLAALPKSGSLENSLTSAPPRFRQSAGPFPRDTRAGSAGSALHDATTRRRRRSYRQLSEAHSKMVIGYM